MKSRLLLIAIALVGLTALYCGIVRPRTSKVPQDIRDTMADLRPAVPPLEPPEVVLPPVPTVQPPILKPIVRNDPVPPKPEVPIQNGATIDFSTGAPVVKIGGKDQDALEAALKEIAEATKN